MSTMASLWGVSCFGLRLATKLVRDFNRVRAARSPLLHQVPVPKKGPKLLLAAWAKHGGRLCPERGCSQWLQELVPKKSPAAASEASALAFCKHAISHGDKGRGENIFTSTTVSTIIARRRGTSSSRGLQRCKLGVTSAESMELRLWKAAWGTNKT